MYSHIHPLSVYSPLDSILFIPATPPRTALYYIVVLPSAWRSRVRWHNVRGRPRHSRRVLKWNGLYVLYDLHLPPAVAPLPAVSWGGISSHRSDVLVSGTSACGRGATFRSNGGLVSPNGRYTFVQHNGKLGRTSWQDGKGAAGGGGEGSVVTAASCDVMVVYNPYVLGRMLRVKNKEV